MGSIFSMFGPSPIRPIEQHMCKVNQCVKQLTPFFLAVIAQDWCEAQKIKQSIDTLEQDADNIKRDLRLRLPIGLFLPVGRSDLLELLSAQDKIANRAEDIAELVVSRKMLIPASLATQVMTFLARCLDASEQACKAINELDDLLESGFRGSEVSIVEQMILKLEEIEQDSDAKLAMVRQAIIKLEQSLPAIDIMFLYKLVQWIDDLADYAQMVGGRLQILIAR
ncbi:MAG: TIGR00153 family protein [Legionellaceae bacterium]|nr:TIGR00153 family protein [Legionellaceae bacterium]HCA90278.1 TIGR00153 family protein [Legionellales bacterium]|tara:strand:- start:271 stop:942 length:672 start_codon:yes stop_codon:yes gene_type:complete